MNRIFLAYAFAHFVFGSAIAAIPNPDSTSTDHVMAATLTFTDFSFDAGIGATVWFSKDYSVVASVEMYDHNYYDGTTHENTDNYLRDAAIKPSISLRRHFSSMKNVSPFIGLFAQPSWSFGQTSKATDLIYGTIFGVESWITEAISVTGQHSLRATKQLNSNQPDSYDSGLSQMLISFYF